jgi:predicted DNA-binding WGR domain protein
MALLTLNDADNIAARSRPWTLRLEYSGSTAAGNSSHKFWYATGRGYTEAIEIGWGRVGSEAQHQLIDWPEFRTRLKEKLSKGYEYADGPFMRMTPGSLAKLGAPTLPATPAAAPVPPPSVPSTPGRLVTLKAPSAGLLALGEPYSLIRALRMQRTGTKIEGYTALDEAGDDVLDLDAVTGREFAKEHDLEIVFA